MNSPNQNKNFSSLPTKDDDLDLREKGLHQIASSNDLHSLTLPSSASPSDKHQTTSSVFNSSPVIESSTKVLLDKDGQSNDRVVNMWIEGFGASYPRVCVCLLALLGGGIGSLGGVAYKYAWESVRSIYTSQEGFVSAARAMPNWWLRFSIPTAAGVIGGSIALIFKNLLSEKAFGPEYVEAVRDGDGRLNLLPNLVRSVLAVVIVAGGFTIGREGTMVQFSALAASFAGELLCLSVKWQRLFVAFGAAAGFAAAYLSPLAAAMFLGRVLINQSKDLHEIVAVLLAALLSQLLVMQLVEQHVPLYESIIVAPLTFNDQFNGIVVGIIAGIFGAFFQISVEFTRGLTVKYIRSFALRIFLAGLVVGSLSIARPEVWGNGYSTLQRFLRDDNSTVDLAEAYIVFILRFLAVLATSASCVPGGVLTPIMMFGGTLGLTVGELMLIPTAAGEHQLWTMVGMAALLSTMMNAPVVAAVMVFELTQDYNTLIISIPAAIIALLISSFLKSKILPYVQVVKKAKKRVSTTSTAAACSNKASLTETLTAEEKKIDDRTAVIITNNNENALIGKTVSEDLYVHDDDDDEEEEPEEVELGMTKSHYGDIHPICPPQQEKQTEESLMEEVNRLNSISTRVRKSFDSALL